jgi:replicative DNA helicase
MTQIQKAIDSTKSLSKNHLGHDEFSLRDPGTERTLLGTVIKIGKDALLDLSGIITPTDFALPINKVIYTCLERLAEDPNCQTFDIESIKLKAKALGFDQQFERNPKALEYLELLDSVYADKENLTMFALQVKKYSIVRDLYGRYSDAQNYLKTISGNEDLSEIIRKAEGQIVDFITGVDNGNNLENLCQDMVSYIEEAIASEPVDQVGLPTGYPIWDASDWRRSSKGDHHCSRG